MVSYIGEMSERSKETDSKSVVVPSITEGSNPSLSGRSTGNGAFFYRCFLQLHCSTESIITATESRSAPEKEFPLCP